MNCDLFYNWLEERDVHDISEADQALKHAEKCQQCHDLYQKDEQLNSLLSGEMAYVAMPARLKNRIDLNLDQPGILEKTTSPWWAKMMPVGLAAMLLIYLVFPIATGFKSMDTIGQYVLADHLGHGDDHMVVRKLDNLSQWCEGKVDFAVNKPEMPKEYTFVGARICPLGEYDSVHLSYTVEGKRMSLFIVDAGDVAFTLRKGRKYALSMDGYNISFWKKNERVYALIG